MRETSRAMSTGWNNERDSAKVNEFSSCLVLVLVSMNDVYISFNCDDITNIYLKRNILEQTIFLHKPTIFHFFHATVGAHHLRHTAARIN